MTDNHRDEDLTRQLHSPGWRLTGDKTQQPVTGTLNDVLVESHSRKSRGEHPGRIQKIVTTIELDMIQIEQLWRYLGLPTI